MKNIGLDAPSRINTPLPQDRPSRRMLKIWAKRIAGGQASTIPVFVGGAWTLNIPRGHKRVLQLALVK